MKFPMAVRPVAPLQLPPAQCAAYERMVMDVMRAAVNEFDTFVNDQHRAIDATRWKPIKTKEHVTVYKMRSAHDALETVEREAPPPPQLWGVGSIVGDLDDVLYGVLSPDAASIRVKTAYVDDDVVDCDVLQTIQHATLDDPFRFVGIKWLVQATPSGTLGRPRDMVILEGTGIYVDATGQRYGYHVMQSVELPQCPSLQHLGIVRSKVTSCYLFTPRANRSVEIFMKSYVAPAGSKVPDGVAMALATNSLLNFWKTVLTAEKKKLTWLLRQAFLTARARHRGIGGLHVTMKTDDRGRNCCALCERTFSSFRAPVGCELCHLIVCARCETTRKLTTVDDHGTLKKEATPLCKNCITAVSNMNAADFARCERVVRPDDVETLGPLDRGGGKSGRLDSWASTERGSLPTTMSVDSSVDELPAVVDEEVADGALVARPVRMRPPQLSPQEQLWRRMVQLRVQAEQAYQLTTQNSHVMATSMGGGGDGGYSGREV